MSTNNFSFENILVVLPDFSYDGSEIGDNGLYQELYDEYVADVQSQLAQIGFESCEDKWESGRDGGKIIARYGMDDTDGMIVWLEVVIRSGYYYGANIDYTIDGDFGIPDENTKKQIAHYEAMHRKLDRLVAKTEAILRKNGTEMLKVGQFSNGEAVYKLKNKKNE